MLSDDQKTALLRIARDAVVAEVTRPGRRSASREGSEAGSREGVTFPAAEGTFVTIKRRGELRGCLGTLRCDLGLAAEVARCAADAASEDPRFERVCVEELTELSLEVSVLGPLESIDASDHTTIHIGHHGLVVEEGRRRGLLLPQVAIEWGWTVEQFLRQTCIKAGLSPDAWRHGARVYRFEAEVFGE
jgi:AmmeMemoRadiSam system protein A